MNVCKCVADSESGMVIVQCEMCKQEEGSCTFSAVEMEVIKDIVSQHLANLDTPLPAKPDVMSDNEWKQFKNKVSPPPYLKNKRPNLKNTTPLSHKLFVWCVNEGMPEGECQDSESQIKWWQNHVKRLHNKIQNLKPIGCDICGNKDKFACHCYD